MSAKDIFHNIVKDALILDGWTITHDPYRLSIGRRKTYIDLGAEMPIAAEKAGRRIAVEIKSFLGKSTIDDLEDALGQFGVYRIILEVRDPERMLYLALPSSLRNVLMEEVDFRRILFGFQARLIFFDSEKGGSLEWIEPTNIVEL